MRVINKLIKKFEGVKIIQEEAKSLENQRQVKIEKQRSFKNETQHFEAKITSINQTGYVEIQFSEEVYLAEDLNSSHIELRVLPSSLDLVTNKTKYDLSWKVSMNSPRKLQIKVNFANPVDISTNKVQDRL